VYDLLPLQRASRLLRGVWSRGWTLSDISCCHRPFVGESWTFDGHVCVCFFKYIYWHAPLHYVCNTTCLHVCVVLFLCPKKVVFCLTCAVGVLQGPKYDASNMPSDLIKSQTDRLTDWLTDQTSWSWVYNLPAFCAARCFLAQFTARPVVCTDLRFHWLSNDRRFFTKKSVEVRHIITATLYVWTDRPTDRPTDCTSVLLQSTFRHQTAVK